MRQLVYDARLTFLNIRTRLMEGENIVVFECDLPDCTPSRGKIYFHRQEEKFVVGICTLDNQKTVTYNGTNRDMKFLVKHQAIAYDKIMQIFNFFYRLDAIYSTGGSFFTYYIKGTGYYKNGKFKFRLRKVGSSWRAYILEMPPFEGRNASLSYTHRLVDTKGQYYVCVQDNVPTKERMIDICKLWSNHEYNYIQTGERF